MNRVMCVHFPKWPLQRLRHERPDVRDKPVVLAASRLAATRSLRSGARPRLAATRSLRSGARAEPRIVLCSEQAARLGIRPGMPVTEALAIEPHLVIHEEDPEKDQQDLEQLAEWLVRFSPCVGLEEGTSPQSLLADITGCAAVFKGEDRLLQRAVRELHAEGWDACVAIADTVGAAWALAHYAQTPNLCRTDFQSVHLSPLPVAALRLSSEALQLLSDLGVDRVGQLLALPRAEIPARFGAGVLHRLDQALGRAPEVITPYRTIPEIQASRRFEYATDRFEVLKHTLEELTEEIHAVLRHRHWGARQVLCCLHHEKAAPCELEVTLFRPTGSLKHLTALLRTRLEQIRLAEPVSGLSLRVTAAEPLYLSQADFMETEQTQGLNELSTLIDRLSNRLGRDAVTRPMLVPDPQPEYACRFVPVIQTELQIADCRLQIEKPRDKKSAICHLPSAIRCPVRLWPTPVRIEVMRVIPGGPPWKFHWAGTDYHVTRAWGPERIETGWWRGDDVHRDYYMVATDAGTRFWLFLRQDDNRWFLHGCFD